MLSWFQAAVLGVVQGLTEFLPISSSAHLRVVAELAGWQDPGAAFTAVTQLGTEAAEIQNLYLARDYAGAAAKVPLGFLDSTALLGPKERIAEKMQAMAESGVTTLTVSPVLQDLEHSVEALRVAAEALDRAGVGS